MSKHTPTPWTCSNEGWGDGMADVRGPDHQLVCRIPILLDCPSGDGELVDNAEYEKNRAVILAAPELLEALEWICKNQDWTGDKYPNLDWWKSAQSALAKARGES